ncbi:sterol desaturase family protein [Wenzhouxiangella sediminis]|uniref:Fatty acid hydroxylase family protein n=1 Tax=Wenzhouxiangella sediminis TaxID=1792836 RepID=A0A3E1K9I5_9GAMM|nr:sterol desaturase family protein [Wenzhouxiangella sediminis]RFF30789.1 fatty acid hydroxylase family protein [Wenzhouxiangella sediminis]
MTTNADYRAAYRQENIGPNYSGRAHFGFVLVFTLGGIALCAWRLEAVSALEWLAVPLTFVYANLVEYVGHRWVMHRQVPGLGLIYKRHAGQHHRFFTDRHMALEGWHDCRVVLFPAVLMVFFFGVFALPSGLLLAWLATSNVAWLFVATALGYYLNYELLHLAYHLPDESPFLRLPFLKRLRRLHHRHHDTALMAHKNFNITYPIGDWLFRTRA